MHRDVRRGLQDRQVFLERGRVQDIRPGVLRRLDDELVRGGGGLAERLRGVRQLFLQLPAFCEHRRGICEKKRPINIHFCASTFGIRFFFLPLSAVLGFASADL